MTENRLTMLRDLTDKLGGVLVVGGMDDEYEAWLASDKEEGEKK